MSIDLIKVGKQIQDLRKIKHLTQNELGERLGVSFQAVSKWKRGETLPDTGLLPDLANVLETTIDNILLGGKTISLFKRKTSIEEIKSAIESFEEIGNLLGKDSLFYIGAVEGVNSKMNIDIEGYLKDTYTKEALIAEAALQCLQNGVYIDISDIQRSFEFEHWKNVVLEFANKHGIK